MARRRLLALIVIMIAAIAASSASARSVEATRPCPKVMLSRADVKLALQVKVHEVRCAAAVSVERADYRVVARTTRAAFTYTDGAWRCVNRAVTPPLGVPYVNVVCTASHSRTISFEIGGT